MCIIAQPLSDRRYAENAGLCEGCAHFYGSAQFCQGSLRALNPDTGSIVWQRCALEGPIIGAVTVVPGVVAVGEGTALWLVASSDGHDLFKAMDSSPHSQYFQGPTIANGVLYIGNSNGHFSAFG